MKPLTWSDTDAIAQTLLKKYPDMPPVVPSTEKIREMVTSLENFKDSPHPKSKIYLSGIQSSWIMLWHGTDAEASFRGRPDLPEDD